MARPFAIAISLAEADRATLRGWIRRPKTLQAHAFRARIILLATAEPTTAITALASNDSRRIRRTRGTARLTLLKAATSSL